MVNFTRIVLTMIPYKKPVFMNIICVYQITMDGIIHILDRLIFGKVPGYNRSYLNIILSKGSYKLISFSSILTLQNQCKAKPGGIPDFLLKSDTTYFLYPSLKILGIPHSLRDNFVQLIKLLLTNCGLDL